MSRTFATRFSPFVLLWLYALNLFATKNVFVHFKAFFIFTAGLLDFGFEWELRKVSGVFGWEKGLLNGGANAVHK